jgi:predicted transcriptional regulator
MADQYARAEAMIEELLDAHARGESISSLARKHGLRREAISAVLAEHGIGNPSASRESVLQYVREHPGLSVDDLSLRLDLSKSSISRYVRGADEQRLVVSRKQTDRTVFTDDVMAQSLRTVWRQLDDKSKGLSRMKYNQMRAEGTPAASTYIRRYGSWSAACDMAGITASKARRSNYAQDWSTEQILDAINEYIDETDDTVYHGYTAWAREHGKPSGPLLITRLGGWAKARKEAIKRREKTAA